MAPFEPGGPGRFARSDRALSRPRGWRGDWVQLGCESWTIHRNYLGEKLESCGAPRRLSDSTCWRRRGRTSANALIGARSYAASSGTPSDRRTKSIGLAEPGFTIQAFLVAQRAHRGARAGCRRPAGGRNPHGVCPGERAGALDAMRVIGPITGGGDADICRIAYNPASHPQSWHRREWL